MALTLTPHAFLNSHGGAAFCPHCGLTSGAAIHQPAARIAVALANAGHPPELAPELCAIAARALMPDATITRWVAWHRGPTTAAEFQRFADLYKASAHQLATYRSRPGGAA